ncbi:MAG: S49 family peptidase [Zoogloeaceae bacterium]|jgi:protease-4|nr:S49 family peptidase [Zoogloeaceae bacterium]
MNTSDTSADPAWERKVLENLVLSTLKEQRAKRRWGIFFKFIVLFYFFVLMAMLSGWRSNNDSVGDARHTALINLQGVIDAQGEITAERINAALKSAFENQNTAGVILRINSPGGSPAQSGMIYDEIRRQRALHPDIPLYAVVEDICASGAYFVAAAADRIYVNQSSLVGSIGVLIDGFGFTGAMEKIGVERRLMTAGENKGFLDPFSPVKPEDKAHVEALLTEIHQQFIGAVRAGRGKRLKEGPETFSGLVWSGAKSVELGLSDALGTTDGVARDIIKAEKIVDFSIRENLAERFAKRLGADAAAGFGQSLKQQMTKAQGVLN